MKTSVDLKSDRRFESDPLLTVVPARARLGEVTLKTSLRAALLGSSLAYVCSLLVPLFYAIANADYEPPGLFADLAFIEFAFAIGFFVFIRHRPRSESARDFYATCAAAGIVISVILIPFYYAIVNSFSQ